MDRAEAIRAAALIAASVYVNGRVANGDSTIEIAKGFEDYIKNGAA